MSKESRLDRLNAGLSARERVVLAFRAVLRGEPEDPSLGWTMPDEQIGDVNRLTTMAHGVIRALLPHALLLESEAQVAHRELTLLATLLAWAADRAILASTALDALDAEGRKLSPALVEAREQLRERWANSNNPGPPDTLLPAYALRLGWDPPSRTDLTGMDLRVVGLAQTLEQRIPMLRAWLLTLEQAVDSVVEALDESAIPEAIRELLAGTHEVLDEATGEGFFLSELAEGQIDPLLAEQLAEKLRDN